MIQGTLMSVPNVQLQQRESLRLAPSCTSSGLWAQPLSLHILRALGSALISAPPWKCTETAKLNGQAVYQAPASLILPHSSLTLRQLISCPWFSSPSPLLIVISSMYYPVIASQTLLPASDPTPSNTSST